MITNKILISGKFLFFGIFILAILMPYAVAGACDLDATLVNQDPYPALPGDYVELVFELSDVDNPDCQGAVFEIIPSFPFSLDENESAKRTLGGQTYLTDYKKTWMIPYKLRVDKDAVDGKNEIEVRYNKGDTIEKIFFSEKFDINIEDSRVDFEVYIKEYDKKTNKLTFEILNIGEYDIEALTIDILKQENIVVKGSFRNIVGSLDSKEETVFDFEATPKKGEINLKITYTDQINERRTIDKSVLFEPEYFEGRADGNGFSLSFYLLITLIAVIIIVWVIKWRKKRRR